MIIFGAAARPTGTAISGKVQVFSTTAARAATASTATSSMQKRRVSPNAVFALTLFAIVFYLER